MIGAARTIGVLAIARTAALIGFLIVLPTTWAQAALFAIADPQFCGFVDETTYATIDVATDGSISKTKFRNGALYFSFRVIGGQKAMEQLRKFGSLEVRVTTYAGWSRLGSYQIGIDQENWRKNGKALTDEFNRNGIFNWRTYMRTQQTDYSSITVKISDSNSDYVAPVDVGGAYEATVNILP
jgi:hypothetical protein